MMFKQFPPLYLCAALCLAVAGVGVGAAAAADKTPNALQTCIGNAACQAKLDKAAKFCRDNPAECMKNGKEARDRHKQVLAACKAHPEQCEQRKADFKRQLLEQRRAECAAHPENCR